MKLQLTGVDGDPQTIDEDDVVTISMDARRVANLRTWDSHLIASGAYYHTSLVLINGVICYVRERLRLDAAGSLVILQENER
jgi:hypothetical protein